MYEIKNNRLTAKISRVGGELKSLKLDGGNELMFQGHEEFPFSSPLLFPIVGKLKDDSYVYKQKIYQMEIHGFLRYSMFGIKNSGVDFVVLSCEHSCETMNQFPFEFEFEIEYRLNQNQIEISYEITSNSDEMYFSFGFHPAFNCKYIGKSLHFEQMENATQHKLVEGIIQAKKSQMQIDKTMIFDENSFSNKAMILSNLKSKTVFLECDECTVKMEIAKYPYFAIWSNHSDFVCLEPWLSTADSEDISGNLSEKPDMIKLQKSQKYKNNLNVIIERKI